MRPALLNQLFAPVTSLAGVGPRQDKLFRYLLGRDSIYAVDVSEMEGF